jgi:hypothetical protein
MSSAVGRDSSGFEDVPVLGVNGSRTVVSIQLPSTLGAVKIVRPVGALQACAVAGQGVP